MNLETPYLASSIFLRDRQLEESYNLLQVNLKDFLENRENALYKPNDSNILMNLLEKIRYIKTSYELLPEDTNKLYELEVELYDMIKKHFINEFEEFIDLDVFDTLNHDSINFLYFFFYNNRYMNIISFISNYIDINRKKLILQYKDIKTKDYEFNRFKLEYPHLDNDFIYILINMNDIIATLLSDESITIQIIANTVGVQSKQYDLINLLFENSGDKVASHILAPVNNISYINNLSNQVIFQLQI
jgi:hypothetical protein